MLKVIIAGGRDFTNGKLLFDTCTKILANYIDAEYEIEIVCGEANGADYLGKLYAYRKKFKLKSFPANWDLFGVAAGPIRNGEMADYADVLIAFWDGRSRGTADMIEQAKRNKLIVRIIRY